MNKYIFVSSSDFSFLGGQSLSFDFIARILKNLNMVIYQIFFVNYLIFFYLKKNHRIQTFSGNPEIKVTQTFIYFFATLGHIPNCFPPVVLILFRTCKHVKNTHLSPGAPWWTASPVCLCLYPFLTSSASSQRVNIYVNKKENLTNTSPVCQSNYCSQQAVLLTANNLA